MEKHFVDNMWKVTKILEYFKKSDESINIVY